MIVHGFCSGLILSKLIAAAASEPEANERGSSLIDRRLLYRGLKSLFLTKREEYCGYGRMEDLGCAVVSQGIVVMREWKVKDAQCKVCGWTISMYVFGTA